MKPMSLEALRNRLPNGASFKVKDLTLKRDAGERYYFVSSKLATVMWGGFAIAFAQYAGQLGSLVEAVNRLGSLFYGTLLGIFLLGFYFKRVNGTAAFLGALAGEAAVLYCFFFTSIAFLWFNLVGALVVVAAAHIFNPLVRTTAEARP